VTAGADATARLWPATTNGFIEQACRFLLPEIAQGGELRESCKPFL
jgi:hypothetical protein